MGAFNNGTTDSNVVEQQIVITAINEIGEKNNGQNGTGKTETVKKTDIPIMDKSGQERDMQYQELIDEVTPKHNLFWQMLRAFVSGGLICVLGQGIVNTAMGMGLDKKTASGWCSLLLILFSVLLTGFNLFYRIAKWAGAGILVPITGFANGVASSAIEFQKEGQVFGIGGKIFNIAGPVILYGLVSSWLLGFVYWLGKIM